MDGVYRHQRRIYDVTRKYYLLGRDRLIADLDVPAGGTVLEVACGTGRNLIRIARAYPQAPVYGFDISEQMLRTARAAVARAGLADRITLAAGDACARPEHGPFPDLRFDRVVFSYSLSMIPDWRGALAQGAAHTAPGGRLAVVDFGGQTGLPGWFRSGLVGWLARFHVTPRTDLEAALRDLGGDLRLQALYRDYARYGVVTFPL
ncbi:MAG: methyltransferase domain-containing protein [Pseudomonadota bacterium]